MNKYVTRNRNKFTKLTIGSSTIKSSILGMNSMSTELFEKRNESNYEMKRKGLLLNLLKTRIKNTHSKSLASFSFSEHSMQIQFSPNFFIPVQVLCALRSHFEQCVFVFFLPQNQQKISCFREISIFILCVINTTLFFRMFGANNN